MGLSRSDVNAAALFSAAAYADDPSREIVSGYFLLPFGDPDPNKNVYVFDNGNAQAIVGLSDDQETLVISFRGTDEFYDKVVDGLGGKLGFGSEYSKFQALISAVNQYVADHDSITKVIATGHSLGGVMAERYMADHLLGNGVEYFGVTFGSPSDDTLSGNDPRMINFGHTGDPVVNSADGWGGDANDVVVTAANGLTYSQSLSGFLLWLKQSRIGGIQQHGMDNYLASTSAISRSAGFDQFIANPYLYRVSVGNLTTGTYFLDLGPDFFIGFGSNNDIVYGDLGSDVLDGWRGDDRLHGGYGNDHLYGGEGNDFLFGEQRDDILNGGIGNDLLDGGIGNDTAVFDESFDTGNYTISLDASGNVIVTSTGEDAGTDTLVGIENLQFGGDAVHSIEYYLNLGSGDSDGGGQPDEATGGGDENTGGGGAGSDIVGTADPEHLYGTSAGEAIFGGGGDDILTGYAGQDSFDGGAGLDTVDYSYNPSDVSGIVDLNAGTATFAGFYVEQLTSIENVWMGAGDDQIIGTAGANDLRGGPGDDIITPGGGDDIVYGDWRYSDAGGLDTVILSYDFGSGYSVTGTADALHIVGTEGDDWFFNVENYQFADGTTYTASELLDFAQSTPTPVGDAFLVNTYTENGQVFSSIASFDDGSFVIIWQSFGQDGSNNGIFGQRYNADGFRNGDEFQVNTVTDSGQEHPSVTTLSDGGFAVAWSSSSQDQTGRIYGQLFHPDGTKNGDEFQIDSFPPGINKPALTGLSDGGLVVTWMSHGHNGSGQGIYGQRYNADGSPDGGQFQITGSDGGEYYDPVVTSLDDGGFVVGWSEPDGGAFDVYVQRYTAEGVAVGNQILVNTYTEGPQRSPSMATLRDGSFVVIWTSYGQDGDEGGIYGQHFSSSGIRIGDEFQVNTTTFLVDTTAVQDQRDPAVSALDDGGFIVTWTSTAGPWGDIRGQRFDSDSLSIGGQFQVTDTFDNYNSSVLGLEGGFVVTWSTRSNDFSLDIEATLFSLYSGDDVPTPQPDAFTTSEDNAIGGDLFADNGSGADIVADGATLTITAVNGSADNVMTAVTLESGALVAVSSDGTFTYYPNHAFDSLDLGESASDSFTYTVTDSNGNTSTATVTLTITGLLNGVQVTDGSGTQTGTEAADQIAMGAGDDIVKAGGGGDYVAGGAGNDELHGESGDDLADGGAGNDDLFGGEGNDGLFGGVGNDTLDGGAGNDFLNGGDGADRLFGGAGSNTLTGGAGADEFIFDTATSTNTITDFEVGVDSINLRDLSYPVEIFEIILNGNGAARAVCFGNLADDYLDIRFSQNGMDTEVYLDYNKTVSTTPLIVLEGIDMTTLSFDDFSF